MHKFSYNKFNELENPTIVLSTKYHKHLGTLTNVEIPSVECNFNMASAQEVSFTLYKYKDNIEESLWDSVIDFKYIYIPEHKEYYSIEVQVDESDNTIKHITGTSACEFELSNRILYNFECNTESDILQDDYVVTKFYNPQNPRGSLLNRVLADKCPDYNIRHVDSSLINIQRTFSADGQDIYGFLTDTVAKEIECLFVFDSVNRAIDVYDLKCVCNTCGHRGDMSIDCPNCGSSDYHNKYGETTNIFISSENFAEQISCSGKTDDVFNCLKISGGDNIITTALMYINPNGSQYIYNFNAETLADMPDELVLKINQYNTLYDSLKEPYAQESERYYNAVDQKSYLEHSMAPEVTTPTTDAETEANNLPAAFSNFGNVVVSNISNLSTSSANLAIQNMAKILVDARYDVKATGSISSLSNNKRIWTGTIKITNEGNEEDEATTSSFSVVINGNTTSATYEQYLYQLILKRLDRDDSTFYDIYEITDDTTFKNELKKYSLAYLKGFSESYMTCLNVLTENSAGDPDYEIYGVYPYTDIYKPYKDRLDWITAEIKVRDGEIAVQDAVITSSRAALNNYHDQLDFRKYIGEELWIVYSHYRQESQYTNSNYISDGLDNGEVLAKAKELFEVCEKEIIKASTEQYSLTVNLNNLLNTKEFSAHKDKLCIGNWITAKIDGKLWYLRLININIDYGSIDKLTVTFSDAVRINNTISDGESILSQVKNMASSYSTVMHQAAQGDNANVNVMKWLQNGLNSALVTIKNNTNEDITIDNNGILCRAYDDVTDTYSDEQLRITSNILAFTKDNWNTVSLGLGKHNYVRYDKTAKRFVEDVDYGLSATFVTAGYINGSQIIGGDIYSQNYSSTAGTHFGLNDGTFEMAGGKLKGELVNNIYKLSVDGDIVARSLTLSPSVEVSTDNISGLASVATSGQYSDLSGVPNLTIYIAKDGTIGNTPAQGSTGFVVSSAGLLQASNAIIYGNLYSTTGNIGGFTLKNNALYSGTNSNTSTTAGVYVGTDGIRNYTDSKHYVDIKNGVLTANSVNVTGTVTATNITANTQGTIANWGIFNDGLKSNYKLDYQNKYSYGDVDIARLQGLIIGTYSATDADYEKYDLNGDYRFSASDLIAVQKIINNQGNTDTNVVITPNNQRYTIQLYSGNDEQLYPGKLTTISKHGFSTNGYVSANNFYSYSTSLFFGQSSFDDFYIGQRDNDNIIPYLNISGTQNFSIYKTTGSAHAFTNMAGNYVALYATGVIDPSSKLIKTNILNMSEVEANKILDVNVVSFDYKDKFGGKKDCRGVIAEDVLNIIPSVVNVPNEYREEDFDEEKGSLQPILGVDYSKFVPYLIKKIQMQEQQINNLKDIIEGGYYE